MIEIDPRDLEEGKRYQVESGYSWAVNAVVVELLHDRDDEGYPDQWVGCRIKIDEVVKDFGNKSIHEWIGEEMEVGYNPKLSHYSKLKFKPVGSPTDYATAEDIEKFKQASDVFEEE